MDLLDAQAHSMTIGLPPWGSTKLLPGERGLQLVPVSAADTPSSQASHLVWSVMMQVSEQPKKSGCQGKQRSFLYSHGLVTR